MHRALETTASQGTTRVRAQIDVDEVAGLRGIEAALALELACAPRLGMQVVAVPQEGPMTISDVRSAMREAVRVSPGRAAQR
jgi:cytosine/adenosine deaminase-related metal-dependent hydrolase